MALVDEVRKELLRNISIFEVKHNLTKRGFTTQQIDEALSKIISHETHKKNKNNRIFGTKEFFDRLGYGFANQQFINILFIYSGASYFTLGLVNGIKTMLTYLMSGILREYSKMRSVGKNYIGLSAILYGFSLLGMAFAAVMKSPILFAIAFILGTGGIVAHGDIYLRFENQLLHNEKKSHFLQFISYFGIILTAISLLVSGFVFEMFPTNGHEITFNIFGAPVLITIYGYLITFELAALLFILSGYLLTFVDEHLDTVKSRFYGFFGSTRDYLRSSAKNTTLFYKNRKILLLTIAIVLSTILQILGNAYYGVFIYEKFRFDFMKGYVNVALIFVIALLASIIGTIFTGRFAKQLGEAPMLVFGTLLTALLPLTLYVKPNLYSIGLATVLSVVGGAIVGVAQGLIAARMMNEEELKNYFSSLSYISILPTFILVTIGAIIAQIFDLNTLFMIIAGMFILVIMPLYFLIVLILDKEYRLAKI